MSEQPPYSWQARHPHLVLTAECENEGLASFRDRCPCVAVQSVFRISFHSTMPCGLPVNLGSSVKGTASFGMAPLIAKFAGLDVDFPVPGPHVRLKVCACHLFQPEAWTYLER